MLLLVPLLSFAGVFAGTLAYYELGDDEAPAAATTQAAAQTDGSLIVALEQKPGVRLYVASADGSGGRFVTGDNEPTDGSVLVEAHPDWSPTTERIVLTRYTVKGQDAAPPKIWSVAPDGSDLVQLTHGDDPDFLAAWSPDGERIAFTRELDGSAEVFVMNADGSEVTQLTNDSAVNEEHPAWSPDGTHIAYTSGSEEHQDLYVMSADGSSPTRITGGPFFAADPAWSPQGDRIVFVCDADLCLVRPELGARPAKLVGTRPKESSPRWSADGGSIAFARFPGGVFLVDVQTERTTRVPLDGETFTLSWGPA